MEWAAYVVSKASTFPKDLLWILGTYPTQPGTRLRGKLGDGMTEDHCRLAYLVYRVTDADHCVLSNAMQARCKIQDSRSVGTWRGRSILLKADGCRQRQSKTDSGQERSVWLLKVSTARPSERLPPPIWPFNIITLSSQLWRIHSCSGPVPVQHVVLVGCMRQHRVPHDADTHVLGRYDFVDVAFRCHSISGHFRQSVLMFFLECANTGVTRDTIASDEQHQPTEVLQCGTYYMP
ncbi:hypothetical protein N656DRAFT_57249 [Canariomyces notabilis]|uniref:Uncharacterized protein n=1 Tax=Canariomyces notabilis TaxID=2074819 RepID=A0AAN6TNF0_9PEZI|nr:hypothetical protein N656DRAFT_57249 [Canariomyces arenarius]